MALLFAQWHGVVFATHGRCCPSTLWVFAMSNKLSNYPRLLGVRIFDQNALHIVSVASKYVNMIATNPE